MARLLSLTLRLALCLSVILATTLAIPATVFPFNSQVPTVARVGQPYDFQLSPSTFAPSDAGLVYSISGQPAWLTLDASSLTLTGEPGQADAGSETFTITAADSNGAAQMQCTLVVSSDPFPQLITDLSQQLATQANLSSTSPPTMTLLPGQTFNFQFRQDSFIDIVQRTLYYYATLADHTPLPAWVFFDVNTLTLSGTAPPLSAFPQSFDIELIASDVEGFAGTSASFKIVVAQAQLAFVPEEQDVQFNPGSPVKIADLQDTLLFNGQNVDISTLKDPEVSSMPSWLNFDKQSMSFEGDAPEDAVSVNMSLTASDGHGNTAVLAIHLIAQDSQHSLFSGTIGMLKAIAGESFQYTIPSDIVSAPDATLGVILPVWARWLHFDQSSRELSGDVPPAMASVVTATLTARAPSVTEAQTQVFSISVQAKQSSATTFATSVTSATRSATSTPLPVPALHDEHHGLKSSAIAGVVIGALLLLAFLILLLWTCYRKRKQGRHGRQSTPSKQSISRPLGPPEVDEILVTKELHRDVESAQHLEDEEDEVSSEAEKPPQLALDLPMHSARNSRWTDRFSRISQVSSLGNGEDAIRADSNIPEWGGESTALQTPHDSFSVPAQLARVSRQLSQMSPSKRAFRRLRARRDKHQSEDSLGLGIELGGAAVLPRHSSRRAKSRRRYDDGAGLSATMERSSCASLSSRGTSVLSTRPSEFPRPPTQSTFGGSKSIPAMLATGPDNRQSIRMVGRSDSIATATDNRTMEEKRASYITKRASTTLSNPLFLSSQVTRSNDGSSSASMNGGQAPGSRRSKRIKSQLTSYSESSSVQPTRSSNRLSQRIRSAFAPNYPRAVTRSNLYEDEENKQNIQDNDSDYYTTSDSSSDSEDLAAKLAKPRNLRSSSSSLDLAVELAKPKDQRFFVLPGEASPTPPPVAPPTSRQPSGYRGSTPASDSYSARYRRRDRASRSASPLAVSVLERKASGTHGLKSKLNEPLDLISNDSLSKAKVRPERPKVVQTNSGRPVSVDDVQRLSSLRARTEEEGDALAGSEAWQDDEREVEGTGLLLRSECGSARFGTGRSGMSGVKAFI